MELRSSWYSEMDIKNAPIWTQGGMQGTCPVFCVEGRVYQGLRIEGQGLASRLTVGIHGMSIRLIGLISILAQALNFNLKLPSQLVIRRRCFCGEVCMVVLESLA